MEAIIFMGIQASGKTTFYRHNFFDTHIRLSLDMLKTRHRQRLLIDACILAKQRFVIDNTNVRREERAEFIQQAQAGGFSIRGYFFEPQVKRCIAWNEQREGKACIPVKGILGTLERLERPSLAEGFDQLNRVRVAPTGEFIVEEWPSAPE